MNLYPTAEHTCSYLPGQLAREAVIDPSQTLSPRHYQQLLALGFRRSGPYAYRTACRACQACIAVRIPLNQPLALRRRHRRVLKRNADCQVRMVAGRMHPEHRSLYLRYLSHRHRESGMRDLCADDLLDPAGALSCLCEIRVAGRLLAYTVVDCTPDAWSAVYTVFDPLEEHRGLGNFAILQTHRLAKSAGADFLYLGYWIHAAPQMGYKTEFRPLQIYLGKQWQPFAEGRCFEDNAPP
ncbi:arginyltransferase [Abyssibacter sp.]|jgi:arginine-tRNA-protein transferase|uniref:arginyltransferase n=1 Tax=Abyssibacter sp. TaxID=2320200 RepID=UPI000C38FF7B|nr:arginyltransferase [Abyssibacter sp.]MBB87005.1 arginyltransferase [Xanthomonadales bacterium]MCK5860687.1 arginyltransferase [Abyssibacter sp.]